MKIDVIREAVRATPFKPFILHTAGGRSYRILHPEFIAIAPQNRMVMAADPEHGASNLDLALIESIEFIEIDEKGAA